MLLGTPLNLGNTTSDLRIEKRLHQNHQFFWSCQLWDAPKRKDPIISSMRCSHDPFLSLKSFPGSQATPPKSQATPARLLSDSSLPWEPQSITSIRKLSFELLCIQSCCAYDILGGGELWNVAGIFAALRHWPHNPAKIQRRRLPHQCHPPRSDLSVSFSPQWLTSVSSGCVIGQSFPSNRTWWFTFKSKVRSIFFATTKVRSKLSFLYQLDQLIQMNSLVLESSPKIRLRTKGLSFISFIWLTCWSKALLRPS